jgi:hypothetical protein
MTSNFHIHIRIYEANDNYEVNVDLHNRFIPEKLSINHVRFFSRTLATKSEVWIVPLKDEYSFVSFI